MHAAYAIFATVLTLAVVGLVSYWFAQVIFAGRLRTRRIQARNERTVRCASCGYDLRASTDRCPECGRKIPTAADRAISRGFLLDPEALQKHLPNSDIVPRIPAQEEKPVVVHSCRQWVEGELLAKQLQARGILAELQAGDGQLLPGSGLPNWAVTVPSRDVDVARAIIESFRLKPSDDASNPATPVTG
jgi:hypothetical protein